MKSFKGRQRQRRTWDSAHVYTGMHTHICTCVCIHFHNKKTEDKYAEKDKDWTRMNEHTVTCVLQRQQWKLNVKNDATQTHFQGWKWWAQCAGGRGKRIVRLRPAWSIWDIIWKGRKEWERTENSKHAHTCMRTRTHPFRSHALLWASQKGVPVDQSAVTSQHLCSSAYASWNSHRPEAVPSRARQLRLFHFLLCLLEKDNLNNK